ncbi:MAG: SET domain-containing protein-lysine N-methyltransferase [Verrucomicrobia bacterium]|nr:SET domain-containing protein-lysine N-methyltransferase [Verrucomicrobiota bacterium]
MIHPDTEIRFINEVVGHGVVATRAMPRGTITWVQDRLDRTYPVEELEAFPTLLREVLDKYCYRNREGHYVFCWDHARFMNHSFDSNCLLTPYGLEIAVRDIAEGEELTNDYGCFNIIEAFRPCEEDGGREVVRPDDLKRCHGIWDEKIRQAVADFPRVPQPLASLVSPGVWRELESAAVGTGTLASVSSLLFTGR